MSWAKGQGFLPHLQLLNISDIFCAFWIINFLVWNFLHEEKTCPACISHTQNTAFTVLLNLVFCIILPLHLILSHSLLSFILLTRFLARALEFSGAKRVFSQSASGSLCPPHQRAPIILSRTIPSHPVSSWGCTGQLRASAGRLETSAAFSPRPGCPQLPVILHVNHYCIWEGKKLPFGMLFSL